MNCSADDEVASYPKVFWLSLHMTWSHYLSVTSAEWKTNHGWRYSAHGSELTKNLSGNSKITFGPVPSTVPSIYLPPKVCEYAKSDTVEGYLKRLGLFLRASRGMCKQVGTGQGSKTCILGRHEEMARNRMGYAGEVAAALQHVSPSSILWAFFASCLLCRTSISACDGKKRSCCSP